MRKMRESAKRCDETDVVVVVVDDVGFVVLVVDSMEDSNESNCLFLDYGVVAVGVCDDVNLGSYSDCCCCCCCYCYCCCCGGVVVVVVVGCCCRMEVVVVEGYVPPLEECCDSSLCCCQVTVDAMVSFLLLFFSVFAFFAVFHV